MSVRTRGGPLAAPVPAPVPPAPPAADEIDRVATAARRFYLEGASKAAIASELGLSRFRVARMLDRARSSGLVRIELRSAHGIDLLRSVRLAARLGLSRCVVVESAGDSAAEVRAALGSVAAELLAEVVRAEDVLGLAWSRTLLEVRSALHSLPPCAVVQLSGALTRSDVDGSSIELVRDVARIAGGPAYCFYAPMIVDEPETARSLRRQPEVAAAMRRFGALTKAVVTIGGWGRGASTVADAVDDAEREQIRRLGGCAELCGIHLDGAGEALQTSLAERIIGIDAVQLRATPEIIALAYGAGKVDAVRAVVRGGLASSLVTDGALARALLNEEP